MGLTVNSTGHSLTAAEFFINKSTVYDRVIALAGNPNVGKSTVFNELTGLNQHTGNWPGKTVSNAQGTAVHNGKNYILVDIPGTYSLSASSREEEVARDFICFGNSDAVIVVCDATCLERNINLVLQTLQITNNVVVCVNLLDEAEKKGIKIDFKKLSQKLGVPVTGAAARSGKGLDKLLNAVEGVTGKQKPQKTYTVRYPNTVENAVNTVSQVLEQKIPDIKINPRWTALKIIGGETELVYKICDFENYDIWGDSDINEAVLKAKSVLNGQNISTQKFKDITSSAVVLCAEDICSDTISFLKLDHRSRDLAADKILTGKFTGVPVMLALLAVVLWITISGANIISDYLSAVLFGIEDKIVKFCIWANIPGAIYKVLIFGAYRVTAWVVSVMLPPMAIFFPLFTLLEDLGYLPRVAFNLDHTFKKCCACGKQALTMCMGFGCNAAGIVGCRIIDSPRERLIAMLTNSFVPCNGRFPAIISIAAMFFVFAKPGICQTFASALFLTCVVFLGIAATFIVSKVLSKTILKGEPSSFTLELPPYRRPRVGKIIVRSIFDRTLFVLGRAVAVAAPAGIIIWLFANISINGTVLLKYVSNFLDPFARLMGLDGVILFAFILGLPANEIAIPVMIMAYMSSSTLVPYESYSFIKDIFVKNGWTVLTAINTVIFCLMHWPCSTTLLTVKKETGDIKWALLAAAIPTVCGIVLCMLTTAAAHILKIFI